MPYLASEAHGKTRKANTAKRSRQWIAVYESSRARGDDEGTAHAKASGVVKKNWKKTNPAGRKPVDHRPLVMRKAAEDTLLEDVGRGVRTGSIAGGLLGVTRSLGDEAAHLPTGTRWRLRGSNALRGWLELGLLGGAVSGVSHGVKRLFSREKKGWAKEAGWVGPVVGAGGVLALGVGGAMALGAHNKRKRERGRAEKRVAAMRRHAATKKSLGVPSWADKVKVDYRDLSDGRREHYVTGDARQVKRTIKHLGLEDSGVRDGPSEGTLKGWGYKKTAGWAKEAVSGSVGQAMTNARRLQKSLKKAKPGSGRRVANVVDRALEGTAMNTRS